MIKVAKVDVEGSNPFSRSNCAGATRHFGFRDSSIPYFAGAPYRIARLDVRFEPARALRPWYLGSMSAGEDRVDAPWSKPPRPPRRLATKELVETILMLGVVGAAFLGFAAYRRIHAAATGEILFLALAGLVVIGIAAWLFLRQRPS